MYQKIILFIPLLLFILLIKQPPQNCDIWWHMQIGRDILENQIWPSPDRYSYITNETEWVVHSWLADCLFYGAYRLCGESSLVLMRYVFHGSFALFLIWISIKKGIKKELAVCVGLVGLYMVSYREIRPFLFSQLFISYLFLFIATSQPPLMMAISVPIVMLIWVNIHPLSLAFSLVIGLIFVFLIFFKKRYPEYSSTYLFAILIALPLSLIHPTPASLLWRFFEAPSYPTPDWDSMIVLAYRQRLTPFLFEAFLLIAIALWFAYVFLIRKCADKKYPAEMFFSSICLLMAILYMRSAWMIVFPLISALSLHDIGSRWLGESKKGAWKIPFYAFVILQIFRGHLPPKPYFPQSAVRYINENHIKGNFFTDWFWSGYLTFYTDANAKVFVDTRIEPFTSEQIALYWKAKYYIAENLEYLVNYNTEYILLTPEDADSAELVKNNLAEILESSNEHVLLKINVPEVKRMLN
ncbi:MAG: hypothetical protein AB1656_17275 [Candidatus Omnitrophota bacterium]